MSELLLHSSNHYTSLLQYSEVLASSNKQKPLTFCLAQWVMQYFLLETEKLFTY